MKVIIPRPGTIWRCAENGLLYRLVYSHPAECIAVCAVAARLGDAAQFFLQFTPVEASP